MTGEIKRDELDLAQVFRAVRRHWLPVLALTLLVVFGVYFAAQRQARVYEATGSVMAASSDVGNSVANTGVVATPQLPQGAVAEVLQSRSVVLRIIELIRESELPEASRTVIADQLQSELNRNGFKLVTVRARVDAQQRGIYELRALSGTPEGARVLTDSAMKALLEWDAARAKRGITLAKQTLQGQVDSLDAQIAALPTSGAEREALAVARGQARLNLSQVQVLEQVATGNLVLLSEANTSNSPISPKPLRNAVLAGVLALMGGFGLAVLVDALSRRVRSSADLLSLNVPVIGELPKLRRAQRSLVVNAVSSGELYEPTGFIRANLSAVVNENAGRASTFVLTSARPGEGKSTVVVSLATSFAASGKRVLIMDLDVHRPTQHEYWNLTGRSWVPLSGSVQAGQTTLLQAVQHPEQASAVDLGNGVFLLPASQATRREAGLLTTRAFAEQIKAWTEGFDVVLLDSAPVLSVADALVIGPQTDGMVLVVEANGTSMVEIQRMLQSVNVASVKLLGIVLNKLSRNQGYGYTYGRSYTRDE
ncbi:P-loop NTPase [Deinococcus knuensis]|uniref:ExoP n=1 Tax=Deinococcus knuensis TaxID=1837380 RepID=A0ABQ2SQ41_9DEIO|nr:P-loop NTPase [Deinococcus knuensis]GGS36178.1 exoP [Deinococcus knuensis]